MILEQLTQKELEQLEKVGHIRKFFPGDNIMKEGESGASFCLILEGKVEVRKAIRGSQLKTLVELGPCDLIGELGFFGVASRTASVIAITEGQLLEFRHNDFQDLTEHNPKIGAKIYYGIAKLLAERLATNDETLMDTIVWALGRPANQPPCIHINIARQPRLQIHTSASPLCPPSAD